jgi:excinuclease ABC subunit B
MYADQVTNSMQRAISETNRRRQLQMRYNDENGIDPKTIRKAVTDILSMIRPANPETPLPKSDKAKSKRQSKHLRGDFEDLAEGQLERLIMTLEAEMNEAAGDLRFEYAARLRDEIREIKRDLKDMK